MWTNGLPPELLNTVHCMDCLEFMRTLPDGCIDLTVTSPPYDELRNYEWSLNWDFEVFSKIAKELSRITKEWWVVVRVVWDATINWSETGTSFRQALYFKDECWMNIHDTMIYKKTWCPFPEQNRYYPIFEYMFIFSKWKPKTTNLIEDRKNVQAWSKVARKSHARQVDWTMKANSAYLNDPERLCKEVWVRYNVWDYLQSATEWDRIKLQHPATFPHAMAQDHILSRSNQWMTILDCFAWSWTTGVACKELWRNYILVEKEPKYVDIIHKRLQKTTVSLFHS